METYLSSIVITASSSVTCCSIESICLTYPSKPLLLHFNCSTKTLKPEAKSPKLIRHFEIHFLQNLKQVVCSPWNILSSLAAVSITGNSNTVILIKVREKTGGKSSECKHKATIFSACSFTQHKDYQKTMHIQFPPKLKCKKPSTPSKKPWTQIIFGPIAYFISINTYPTSNSNTQSIIPS
ncbi:hypothetical protein Droror1_Dr00005292 [Drosera rotundifolia]